MGEREEKRMNKEKARIHLKLAYESLNFWRSEYVYTCRNEDGWIKEQRLKDIVSIINERKERISRLQRYAY